MFLCRFTKWQRNKCEGMREIQWAQVTVSKQYREHAFRKPPSTTMDDGWIKGSFDPWQRSLFVPSLSSANTKEKGPLLAGKHFWKSGYKIRVKFWCNYKNRCLSLHIQSWARGQVRLIYKNSLSRNWFGRKFMFIWVAPVSGQHTDHTTVLLLLI